MKHMWHDHRPLLRDVTADMENTASSIVVCWTVFTELLPGNALIKSVTIFNEIITDNFEKAANLISYFRDYMKNPLVPRH
jgi:hypothetical protein